MTAEVALVKIPCSDPVELIKNIPFAFLADGSMLLP